MILSFSRTSLKFLEKCELKTRAAIVEAIRELPDKGDIQKLKGQAIKNAFRLRVGRYRVVYVWEGTAIKILRIDTRGDVYK
jgi:mRNA-degrading endonuclease RelE of RelBE toxin-antitoxin system